LQVLNKCLDQRRARAVQRADQADGERHIDAKAAHRHAAFGIVEGGQRVDDRDPTPARTIAQMEAALWVSTTIRRFT
jgi:hypothetical protein